MTTLSGISALVWPLRSARRSTRTSATKASSAVKSGPRTEGSDQPGLTATAPDATAWCESEVCPPPRLGAEAGRGRGEALTLRPQRREPTVVPSSPRPGRSTACASLASAERRPSMPDDGEPFDLAEGETSSKTAAVDVESPASSSRSCPAAALAPGKSHPTATSDAARIGSVGMRIAGRQLAKTAGEARNPASGPPRAAPREKMDTGGRRTHEQGGRC